MKRVITVQDFSNIIRSNPLSLHVSPIGLIRMGRVNEERFGKFNDFLNEVQNKGGNIAIPAFSYSFVGINEVYNVLETPSSLDKVSEYLRCKNKFKRTVDANFSYLLFGNSFSDKHSTLIDYASFGEGSLIEEIYLKDGYLGAVGGVLEHLTEVHYIERKLNVGYRFDKDFDGVSVDVNGVRKAVTMTYSCRDLDSDYIASFSQLKSDLRESGLIKKWSIEGFNMRIEVIKFSDIYDFIAKKLASNPKYLWGIK